MIKPRIRRNTRQTAIAPFGLKVNRIQVLRRRCGNWTRTLAWTSIIWKWQKTFAQPSQLVSDKGRTNLPYGL